VSRVGLLLSLTAPTRGPVEEVVLALLQRLDPADFRIALAAPAALLDRIGGDLHGVPVEMGRCRRTAGSAVATSHGCRPSSGVSARTS
jgi:hypothetical protein